MGLRASLTATTFLERRIGPNSICPLAEGGLRQLERAATGPELTDYHVEAAIAWVHTSARRTEDTDWATIISLYDKLMAIRPSPEMSNSFLDVASWQGFVHHKWSKKRFGDSFDTFNG